MFRIEDGREHFYQWDLNRRVIVEDSSITQVHFCNKTDNCSLVVDVYEENGVYLADVPNILLQTDWKINVYGYDKEYTKHCNVFKVQNRTKPADYVYTETEVKSWEDLEERISELENSSGSDCYSKEETDELLLDKVDKENGKGLSTEDFTTELNMVVNNVFNDLFDDVITDNFDPTYEYLLLGGASISGIFKVLDSDNNFIGILEREYSDDYPDEWEGYYIATEWFEDLNGVVWVNASEDGVVSSWEVTTWHKISLKDRFFASNVSGECVTKEEFDSTIGDIQSLLDSTISLADSYIGEVIE